MNSFYNIIKISGAPDSFDSIAIGLIAFSNGRYFSQFSGKKIRIAKNLIGDNSELIDYFQNQITTRLNDLNREITSSDSELFVKDNLLTANYFEYLSRYSNNMIQFSKPFLLNIKLGCNEFNKLFLTIIGDEVKSSGREIIYQQQFEDRIRENLIDTVKEKVHVYAKLTDKVLPSLYFEYELDCIGMNGVITAAKSIDFSKSEATIDKYLSHYFQVSSLLVKNYNKDKKDNNFYLIVDEPKISNSKEHHIWAQLRKQKQFELVASEEVQIISEKIKETNSGKFLDLEN